MMKVTLIVTSRKQQFFVNLQMTNLMERKSDTAVHFNIIIFKVLENKVFINVHDAVL